MSAFLSPRGREPNGMETLFRWSSRHPLLSLSLSVGVCLLFATGVFRLRIDASLEHLLSEDDPRLEDLREIRENFGNRPFLAVVAESNDLFSRPVLERLGELDRKLGAIDGVVASRSLFRVSLPVSGNGGLMQKPLLDPIPSTPEALEEKRREVLANRLLRNHLVNERGDATLLVYFLPPEGKGEIPHSSIIAEMKRLLAEPTPGIDCRLVGAPRIKQDLEQYIAWELTHLTPVAVLVVGLVIFLFFRHPLALLLPFVTGSLSCLGTLGFMGYAGFEISVFLSTILILILVLGSTEDLHLLSEYFDRLARGEERLDAIVGSGATTGTALFLTAGTTVLGFASLGYSEIEGMRHFAMASSFGLAINFVVTALTVPSLLALFPTPRRLPAPHSQLSWLRKGVSRLHSRAGRRFVLAAGIGAMIVAAGLTRLERDTDYLRFFSQNAPVLRDFEQYRESFPEATSLPIIFETRSYQGVTDEQGYQDLLRLRGFLEENYGSTLSFPDLVDTLRNTRGDPPLAPEDPVPVAELRELLNEIPGDVLKPLLDYDASRAALMLRTSAMSSSEILRLESEIREFASETFGARVTIAFSGEVVLTAHLCDVVTGHLLRNLVLLAAVVAVVLTLATGSLLQGLLSLIPNLLPIALTFGAMGWLGIPLSIATFPVANIAFGIALDDTIHLLLRYNASLRTCADPERAISRTFDAELRPILATSTTMAAGYLTVMLSPLRVNVEIGLLFVIAIATALLADLLLTPLLLKATSRQAARRHR